MGWIGLAASLTGFSTTFLIPMGKGTFEAPWVVYVHGVFAFGWVVLFVVQSLFIQNNKFRRHRLLGFSGILIAVGVAVTIVPVGLYQVEKELAEGLGPTAVSSIVGNVTSAVMFIAIVTAAMLKRREPAVHKRLMLLATLLLLWPAWFRFRHLFPSIPHPEIWFAIVLADSLILLSMIWDKITNRRIHPTFLYVGFFIIAEHTLEAYLFDNSLWREIAGKIYELLT